MNTYVLLLSLLSTILLVSLAFYINFISRNMLIGTIITFITFFLVYNLVLSKTKEVLSLKEGLTPLSMNAGSYPESRLKLPLEDIYPANVPFKNSEYTFETMWKKYPSFPAKSMKTNQIKYWDNPTNGTCSLPHQCGAFYKNIKPEEAKKPNAPSWGSGIRVNFYDTCKFAKK